MPYLWAHPLASCRTRLTTHLLVGGLLAALMGCMSSSREEALRNSIDKLEGKVASLEKELQVRDEKIKTIGNKAATVDSTQSNIEEVKRQVSLTQGAVDELRIKFARLSESQANAPTNAAGMQQGTDLAEDGENATGSHNKDDSKLAELERRVARLELEVQSKSETQAKDHTENKKSSKADPKYASTKELTKVLGGHFTKKSFTKVQSLASEVLSSGLGNDYKEIALLFKAEASFALENYKAAAIEFADFLTRFPASDRRPRALLLAGDSYVYLKQFDTAKTYYRECVEKFPKKQECTASKERLDRLGT